MNSNQSFEPGHVALITGASKGLGLALARLLAERGFRLVITARRADQLARAAEELSRLTEVISLPGDVGEARHAHALVLAARNLGQLDLLVNNASTLGASPMPALADLPPDVFREIFNINVYAPLHLMQHALPLLRASGGTIVNVTSDAGVQAYPGWGGYGSSKAALEHISRTFSAENDDIGVIVADPGNMQTELHQLAEPGEDLSSLPVAETIAPALLEAIARRREPFERIELQTLVGAPA
jgi:NAD(P)-dependent dehydrogenase (short-subunit alcohol dehydrogenase family)